jgi:non-canonical (house-cleaning) NTP pyrophosphatase
MSRSGNVWDNAMNFIDKYGVVGVLSAKQISRIDVVSGRAHLAAKW